MERGISQCQTTYGSVGLSFVRAEFKLLVQMSLVTRPWQMHHKLKASLEDKGKVCTKI